MTDRPTKLIYDDAAHTYHLDGKRWPGASNYGGQIENQHNLIMWGKRQAARGVALDEQVRQQILLHLDDDAKLDRLAEQALTAAGANRSRDRGSEIHRITEQHDKGLLPVLTPDMVDVVKRWQDVLADHDITLDPDYVERIVVFPEFRVCGTFDRLAWHRGRRVVLDLKTGKRSKFMHGMCVQLALLANAPWITHSGFQHGEKTTFTQFDEMPEVDLECGLIVSMPSDGTTPVVYEMPLTAGIHAARIAKAAKAWTSSSVGHMLTKESRCDGTDATGAATNSPAASSGSSPATTGVATASSANGDADSTQTATDDPFHGLVTGDKAAWLDGGNPRVSPKRSNLDITAGTATTTATTTTTSVVTVDGRVSATPSLQSTAPTTGVHARESTRREDRVDKNSGVHGKADKCTASTAATTPTSSPAPAGATSTVATTWTDAERDEKQRVWLLERLAAVKRNPQAMWSAKALWSDLPPFDQCSPEHYANVDALLIHVERGHELPFIPAPLPPLPDPPEPTPRHTLDEGDTVPADDINTLMASIEALTEPERSGFLALAAAVRAAGHSVDPRTTPSRRRYEIVRAMRAFCDEELLRAGLVMVLGDVCELATTGDLLGLLTIDNACTLRLLAESLAAGWLQTDYTTGECRLLEVA